MVENLIEIFLNTTPNGLFYKKGNNIKFMAGWSQSIHSPGSGRSHKSEALCGIDLLAGQAIRVIPHVRLGRVGVGVF